MRGAQRASTCKGESQPAQAQPSRREWGLTPGLQYFGKRFLNPLLGRWVSADPLAVHAPGEADLNVYAYVSGAVLKNVDPLGLDEEAAQQSSRASEISPSQAESAAGTGPSPWRVALGVLISVATLGLGLINDDVRGLFGPKHSFEPSQGWLCLQERCR